MTLLFVYIVRFLVFFFFETSYIIGIFVIFENGTTFSKTDS